MYIPRYYYLQYIPSSVTEDISGKVKVTYKTTCISFISTPMTITRQKGHFPSGWSDFFFMVKLGCRRHNTKEKLFLTWLLLQNDPRLLNNEQQTVFCDFPTLGPLRQQQHTYMSLIIFPSHHFTGIGLLHKNFSNHFKMKPFFH